MDDVLVFALSLIGFYFLGLLTPFMFKRFILPRFSDWLQERVDSWRKPSEQSNPRKHTSCPECGAWGRHKKSCSRGKKK